MPYNMEAYAGYSPTYKTSVISLKNDKKQGRIYIDHLLGNARDLGLVSTPWVSFGRGIVCREDMLDWSIVHRGLVKDDDMDHIKCRTINLFAGSADDVQADANLGKFKDRQPLVTGETYTQKPLKKKMRDEKNRRQAMMKLMDEKAFNTMQEYYYKCVDEYDRSLPGLVGDEATVGEGYESIMREYEAIAVVNKNMGITESLVRDAAFFQVAVGRLLEWSDGEYTKKKLTDQEARTLYSLMDIPTEQYDQRDPYVAFYNILGSNQSQFCQIKSKLRKFMIYNNGDDEAKYAMNVVTGEVGRTDPEGPDGKKPSLFTPELPVTDIPEADFKRLETLEAHGGRDKAVNFDDDDVDFSSDDESYIPRFPGKAKSNMYDENKILILGRQEVAAPDMDVAARLEAVQEVDGLGETSGGS